MPTCSPIRTPTTPPCSSSKSCTARTTCRSDVDLERIIPTLQKMLSYESLHTITEAIVLDALSERLDTAMARVLGTSFDDAKYVAAYRTATTRRPDPPARPGAGTGRLAVRTGSHPALVGHAHHHARPGHAGAPGRPARVSRHGFPYLQEDEKA
ncbi:hypothetical protein LP420_05475 [Massilia sp. B-10]|nr:hypothetical protein LP420_05475 [Massilia sp. B-10]